MAPVEATTMANAAATMLLLSCSRYITQLLITLFSNELFNSLLMVVAILQACIGVKSCDVEVSIKLFGDPCRNVIKSLAVEAACS